MIKKSFVCFKPLLALLLLFPLFLTNLQAAAPGSVAGWTFFVRISEGGFGMGEDGAFLLCLSDDGSSFRMISLSNLEDNLGTYTYQATGIEGKVTLGNMVMTFSFQDDRHGNYGLIRGGTVSGGYQMGTFSAAAGTAPNLTTSIIDFNGLRGDMPAIKVSYRLVTEEVNTYYRMDGGIPSVSNGVTLQHLNRSTTRMYFNDGIMGTGHTHLMFDTPTTGLFAYKIGSGKAYELGTFTWQVAAVPEITLQPTDQSVVHGGTATFSAAATGYQPMTFQWYKDDAPIPGANQTTYTVNTVTANDAGNYKFVASNFLGTGISDDARLTPICPTALSKDYVWFNFRGGTKSVDVINSDCVWVVKNTNTWIEILPQSDESGIGTLYFSAARNTNTTPRTGHLRIGTSVFKVAQNGTFAPSSLAGKTLRIDVNISTDSSPTNVPLFFATNPGRTNHFFFSTLDGANTNKLDYTYERINPTTARASFITNQIILLTFTNYISGNYFMTNTTNSVTFEGPFVLSQRRGDVTIDGHSDLRWQNSTGQLQELLTDGDFVTNDVDTNHFAQLIGVSDFTRDGKLDSVYFSAQRVLVASVGNGKLLPFRGGAKLSPDWRVVTTEDLSGDDYPDVLFQHKDGRLAYWEIGGATNYFKRAVLVRDGKPAPTNWLAVSAADINGDRQMDVVLWNQATRKAAVWYFNNGDFVNSEPLANSTNVMGTNWRIRAVADMNFDGQNDLLWQHKNSGVVRIWSLNGTNKVAEKDMTYPDPDPSWILIGP